MVQHHAFLTAALDGGDRLVSRLGRFIPGKGPPLPTEKGVRWPQTRSGRFGEKKSKCLDIAGNNFELTIRTEN